MKARKTLSEGQAWREIARRVYRLESHEGYLCDQIGYLEGLYGKSEPFDYPDEPRIGSQTAARMKERVRAHVDGFTAYPESGHLDWSDSELDEFRKARVLAALWLALESEYGGSLLRSEEV